MYQLIMASPYNIVIRKDIFIKGPKGMASFLSFFPDNSRNIENTAPIRKDNNIFKSVFFNPNIKPSTAMSFMSPPPMAPLEIIAIRRNNNPPLKKPSVLPINAMVVL